MSSHRARSYYRVATGKKTEKEAELITKRGRVIDLSHTVLPGKEEYRLEVKNRFVEEFLPEYPRRQEDWYIMSNLTMWSHVGTHLEAPFHGLKDGRDVSEIPLSQLVNEGILLDFSHKETNQPIKREELEAEGKDVKEKDIVIIKTGRSSLYRTPQAHDRPYLSQEAVKWLIEKKIACLATDASGFEVRGVKGQPNHQLLFKKGIPVIEQLTNLDKLTQRRVFIVALPWKVKGLDATPIQVIAIED